MYWTKCNFIKPSTIEELYTDGQIHPKITVKCRIKQILGTRQLGVGKVCLYTGCLLHITDYYQSQKGDNV